MPLALGCIPAQKVWSGAPRPDLQFCCTAHWRGPPSCTFPACGMQRAVVRSPCQPRSPLPAGLDPTHQHGQLRCQKPLSLGQYYMPGWWWGNGLLSCHRDTKVKRLAHAQGYSYPDMRQLPLGELNMLSQREAYRAHASSQYPPHTRRGGPQRDLLHVCDSSPPGSSKVRDRPHGSCSADRSLSCYTRLASYWMRQAHERHWSRILKNDDSWAGL